MATDRELLQMALDALKNAHANEPIWKTPIKEAIEALRARLAQPEPEPYGYIVRRNWKTPTFIEADNVEDAGLPYNNPNYEPVFKAPPQREWQGLTDEEIGEIADDENYGYMDVARAIQAKLKEKNYD